MTSTVSKTHDDLTGSEREADKGVVAEAAPAAAPAAPNASGRPNRFEAALDTPWRRFDAWSNMLLADHGFIRYAFVNWAPVGRDAWRSAQPAPHHIARAARLGVKTVVSLRGGRQFGSLPLEKRACAAHGLAFEEITLRSREAPKLPQLEAAAALLERIEYPALFHCKAGADRAGLMSALYLILREGASVERAQEQLSLRFGHVRAGPTGILDAFFEVYADADARRRAETGDPLDFMTWARETYKPYMAYKRFRAKGWARILVDRVLARE